MRGHKMAVAPIAKGEPVRKFGQIIGFATQADRAGRVGARAQCRDARLRARLSLRRGRENDEVLPPEQRATFEGFRAAERQGRHAQLYRHPDLGELLGLGRRASSPTRSSAPAFSTTIPNIDGVVPFVHGTGCGMAAHGEGFDVLKRTQWGYATHPNLGGVLMVGLGCEVFQIDRMKEDYGLVESDTSGP